MADEDKNMGKARIKYLPSYEISDFHYEFVKRVAGVNPEFISNESSLFDFSDRIKEREEKGYWFSRIEKEYGIDLSDSGIDDLNVARLGSELEKRLEWEKL